MRFLDSTTNRQRANGTIMLEDVINPGIYYALTKSGKVYKVSKTRVKTISKSADGNTNVSTRTKTKYNCINHVKNGARSNINSIINQMERAKSFSEKNNNVSLSNTTQIDNNTIIVTTPFVK